MQRFWTKIVVSVQSHLNKLRLRFEKTTLRERVLLGALGLGVTLYAPVHALERNSVQTEAYIEALSAQSSARLTAQVARRIEANAADAAILQDMKSWGFEADNAAIAQVLIEQKLVATAKRVGADEIRVATLSKLDHKGPTYWVQSEVQLPLRWEPAFRLIDAIGEWPEGFRVTSFRYDITQPGGRVNRDGSVTHDQGTIRYNLAFPVRLKEVPEDDGQVLTSRQGIPS